MVNSDRAVNPHDLAQRVSLLRQALQGVQDDVDSIWPSSDVADRLLEARLALERVHQATKAASKRAREDHERQVQTKVRAANTTSRLDEVDRRLADLTVAVPGGRR